MNDNPYISPQEPGNKASFKLSRFLLSRFFKPLFWNVSAVVCSIAYFTILGYMINTALTAVPESQVGNALYRIVSFAFLPFAFVGAAVCMVALVINIKTQRWIWLMVVLFFSFFFLGHLWMLISENIRVMRSE